MPSSSLRSYSSDYSTGYSSKSSNSAAFDCQMAPPPPKPPRMWINVEEYNEDTGSPVNRGDATKPCK
ncbi:hypothetical protein Y032_0328g2628 [Ancylostoma ceylanicum]|nr:hypothetical protein Y032_0328g2628 [Ancylostoma ceylanicum]